MSLNLSEQTFSCRMEEGARYASAAADPDDAEEATWRKEYDKDIQRPGANRKKSFTQIKWPNYLLSNSGLEGEYYHQIIEALFTRERERERARSAPVSSVSQ